MERGVEGGWVCNVCAAHTNTVFTLPCQHSYCEKCLNIWVGVYTDTYRPGHQEFPCRVCWQLHYTPKDGIAAYRQEADICQLGQSLGNLTMETNDTNTTTSNQSSHLFGQPSQFAPRIHQLSQVPQSINPTMPNNAQFDNSGHYTMDNNSIASEAMDDISVPTDLSERPGVLSTQQLDTLNRNCERDSTHNASSLGSLPVQYQDFGTRSTNRLCYPACQMYHMV